MVGSCLDSMIFEVRPDRFYGSVIPAARRRSCGGPAGAAEAVCCKQPQEHRGWPRSAAPRAAGAHGRRCGAATPLPPSASATTPRLRDTTGAVTPPAAPPRSLRARTAPIPDARAAIPAPRAEPEGAARSGAAMAVSGGAGKGGGDAGRSAMRAADRLSRPCSPKGRRAPRARSRSSRRTARRCAFTSASSSGPP